MPSPKKFSRYGADFRVRIEQAHGGKGIAIRLPTHREAIALRKEFYNFRYALRQEVIAAPLNKDLSDLLVRANEVHFMVDGVYLTIAKRRSSAESKLGAANVSTRH